MPETKLTPEELLAMSEARRASNEMVKRMAQPGDNFVIVDDLVLNKEKNERVIMTVPRHFFLTMDDHRRVKFNAGICSVPVELKDHWYLKAHGCKQYAGGAFPSHAVPAQSIMLGSDELPAVVKIGGVKRPIMDFIVFAAGKAKLSIADWNALPEGDRHEKIVAELDTAAREANEIAAKARAQTSAEAIDAAKVQIDTAADGKPPAPVETEAKPAPDADKAADLS